jgi:hypothetical protein
LPKAVADACRWELVGAEPEVEVAAVGLVALAVARPEVLADSHQALIPTPPAFLLFRLRRTPVPSPQVVALLRTHRERAAVLAVAVAGLVAVAEAALLKLMSSRVCR